MLLRRQPKSALPISEMFSAQVGNSRLGVPSPDGRAAEAEHAVDRVRARFGDDAVVRGIAFEGPEDR